MSGYEPLDQAWCAYYEDLSDVALYTSELEALRAANGTAMVVRPVLLGQSLLDQLKEPFNEKPTAT